MTCKMKVLQKRIQSLMPNRIFEQKFWQYAGEQSASYLRVGGMIGIIVCLLGFETDVRNIQNEYLLYGALVRSSMILFFVGMTILAYQAPKFLAKYSIAIQVILVMFIGFTVGLISAFCAGNNIFYFIGPIQAQIGVAAFFSCPTLIFALACTASNAIYYTTLFWVDPNFAYFDDNILNTIMFMIIAIGVSFIMVRYRKRVFLDQQELIQSREELSDILSSITDVFFALDDKLQFAYMNASARSMLKQLSSTDQSLLGRPIHSVLSYEDVKMVTLIQQIRYVQAQKISLSYDDHFEQLDTFLQIHLYPASRNGVAVYINDVSDHRKLTEQLQQAQKMESMGELSGGIAHDFNNILTIVAGNAELIRRSKEVPTKISDVSTRIVRAAEQGSNLARQLLAFARKQTIELEAIDLNTVISDSMMMLERALDQSLEIKVNQCSEVLPTKIDASKIQQVILNLSINGRDAMPDGGTLSIQTAHKKRSEIDLWQAELDSGEYAELIVSDTGTGMDAATVEHIFEPFFTTKGPNKGTGLGLSTVYGIVKQLQGYIFVESQPNQGTSFYLYFPIDHEFKNAQSDVKKVAAEVKGAGEKVLVVEDEKDICVMMEILLSDMGFSVHVAENAAQARQTFDQMHTELSMIITDVVMPNESGIDLAKYVWQKRSQMPILFMSGFTDDKLRHSFPEQQEIVFIRKPFTVQNLMDKISELQISK